MLLVSLVYVLQFSLWKLLKVCPFDKKHPSSCPRHLSTDGTDGNVLSRDMVGSIFQGCLAFKWVLKTLVDI